MPENIPASSHSHGLLIGDGGLKEGKEKKWKGKRPEEGEKGGKMRAFPPISELFPCTGLSVGGPADYSVLFGFTIASQFSPNSLIAGEL